MMLKALVLALALIGMSASQKPAATPDNYPQVTTYRCSQTGGCNATTNYLVLDSLSHNVYKANSTASCNSGAGGGPNPTACPTEEACANNCVMEISGSVVSPRVYLLDGDKDNYEMLKLTGGELAFDINVTQLPCGMNGALYLSEMLANGGKSDLNPGGAAWGTGYCDAQCDSAPIINGVGNINASGACCNEMDIWEANSRAAQMAPHTCNQTGLYQCDGAECGATGICDKNGCGWNSYRLNQSDYYGAEANFSVNTTKPFTVVTQFPANANGTLTGIRRLYVQAGKVIQTEVIDKTGVPAVDITTDTYCNATGATEFMALGAVAGMGDALTRSMVLIFSLWWDTGSYMQWLDSTVDSAGPCNATEGNPTIIRTVQPDPQVTFSNIKWGEINSTFSST
ncbi:glycoside hydrolase family 7 protein [Xylariaceae sp. FL0255]|nr:glycoside hydrolase family 7 protein [Xylariaceae sp. FL0255]